MMQTKLLTSTLSKVGEDIGEEMGAKMVKAFQDLHPNENPWLFSGREILEKILSQPDCQGIRFYHALDEAGQKTLVSVGIDSQDEMITDITTVNVDGTFTKSKGIVADRKNRPDTTTTGGSSLEWW